MLKNKKGITLIALVITIIVLLILAGVSITMISGDDGIATRAVESKNKTEVADDEEKIALALSEYKLVKIEENAPALEDFLETKDWCESATLVEENAKIKIVMVSGREFDIDAEVKAASESGLFAEDGSVIKTWDELLSEGSVTVEGTKLTKINSNLEGYKLVIPGSIKSCGGDENGDKYNETSFVYGIEYGNECKISVIIFEEGIETIGVYTFTETEGINVYFPESVTLFETYAMCSLNGIAHFKDVSYDMRLDGEVWWDNWDLFNELPEAQEDAMYVLR